MTFDLVIGNPPYQELKPGNRKSLMIWQRFVLAAIGRLAPGGTLSMIHPSAWRGTGRTIPPDIGDAREALKSMRIEWLSMTDSAGCGKVFKGVTIPFDVYVARLRDPGETEIEGTDGAVHRVRLAGKPFIPNFHCPALDRILARDGEERVRLIFNRKTYESRKSIMSETEGNGFVHPCVWTISKRRELADGRGGKLNFHWSDRIETDADGKPIHFGIPKAIFGCWNSSGIPYADVEGRFGMAQHAAGIADDPEVVPLIARAMDSDGFRRIMDAVRFNTEDWNRHVIPLFRKDFWKEFA